MIDEPDKQIDMPFIQIIPKDSAKADDGSWRCTNLFSTIISVGANRVYYGLIETMQSTEFSSSW